MSSLTVYKASAGSGKTFTLAVEYIKFLIKNPTEYRNILAVTFTNKATDEMKTRILGQLFGIANSLGESDDYLNKIAEETYSEIDEVRQTAQLAIRLLIHNYDYFHVETIDTFFQSVLRNLAKELDLSANLRIELNDTAVEQQAVDQMIEDLDSKSPLFLWLMKYIMDNIDENKGWNVLRSVKEFGKMIFNDDYRRESKSISETLSKKGFITEYRKELTLLKAKSREDLKAVKEQFFNTIGEAGIATDDLAGGKSRGIHRYFERLTNDSLDDKDFMPKTVEKHLGGADNWSSKSNKNRQTIISLAETTLIPLLEKAENLRHEAQFTVCSVDATLQNINNLRLLNNIEKRVHEMNIEANRFLLSDTQHLLRLMVDDTDSPFIFEKIGTRLEHIMIDEFQDTSTVQWENFKILLNECMSHCNNGGTEVNNLVVGDIKQSIYRWRSGDWRLLNDINGSFPERHLDIKELKTNYRSAENIVRFNNAFFKIAVETEAEAEQKISETEAMLIKAAYNDVEQEIGKQSGNGLIRMQLLKNADYECRMLEELECTIDEIRSKGVPQQKIAILLRSNKYIPLIANYFTEKRPDVTIVSDEAFRLDRSIAINTIVAALRFLHDSDDKITKACLIKYYRQNVKQEDIPLFDMLQDMDSMEFLPKDFADNIGMLKELPLYDLVEKLYAIFHLDELQNENAYVCAFFDYLSTYINDMSADLAGFLQEWDDNMHAKKIQTDEADGIQLISIHKSKGLEFDNVIVPFCNWKLEMYQGNYIWCRPQTLPYSKIPLIPINYSPKLANSIYADDYKKEHMQNTIDNLNLLYVAFTRAGKNLFVIGKRDERNSRSALLQNTIKKLHDTTLKGMDDKDDDIFPKELHDTTLEGMDDKDDDIFFEYGEFAESNVSKEKKTTENVFLQPDRKIDATLETYDIPIVFRQSNKSKDFIALAEGEEQTASSFIKIGNILHQVFSNIQTADDIPQVLDRFEQDGILYGEDLNREKLQKMLSEYISTNEMVADWFSPHWKLYNECSILTTDKNTGEICERRPDRVMKDGNRVVVIDFKFGKMNDKYIGQVREYMQLLRNMGYPDVKGFLWFVRKGIIKEVTL